MQVRCVKKINLSSLNKKKRNINSVDNIYLVLKKKKDFSSIYKTITFSIRIYT